MNPITLIGNPAPLGATLFNEGVNFSLFAPFATKVELLLFKNEKDTSPLVYQLEENENKTYYYWHIFIPHLTKNQLYGYRVYGENDERKGHFFDSSKILIDPYSKAIVGDKTRENAKRNGENNLSNCLKSVVIDDKDFNWGTDFSPKHPMSKTIIYEMHLAGFTKHPSSNLSKTKKGTYSALIEKIPYLKELGITTVEFLPVFSFDAEDAPGNNINYWGYSPINFFSVHAGYSSEKNNPQAIVNEFKQMVKELHKADIEVILDVVYNHSTENDWEGPTYSFRGIANNAYYLLDENGDNKNFSGTGNTVNANHSVVRRMIIDSLRYWVEEMHIDGFRFDLASILARNEQGEPIMNPPILWSIESDPVLSGVKLIAEPWDAAGLHQVYDFTGDRWSVWHDQFRDTIRSFLKGDAGQIGDFIERTMGSPNTMFNRHYEFKPKRNIHFITSHDGFTLHDLVSYNEKHNWANGEENRDGHNHNLSWNCGVEGETNDLEILSLRKKQMKNALFMLFFSQGTPMILMGDEVGRTQNGNNNAYSQDNEIGWFNWDLVDENKDLLEFTKKLIKLRNELPIVSTDSFFSTLENDINPFVRFHGTKQFDLKSSEGDRSIMIEYVFPKTNKKFLCLYNSYWGTLDFELPENEIFKPVICTGEKQLNTSYQNKFLIEERSVALLEKMN